jgi:hypothetical protein
MAQRRAGLTIQLGGCEAARSVRDSFFALSTPTGVEYDTTIDRVGNELWFRHQDV